MQPTPVLSLGSDIWSPSLSSQAPPALAGEPTSLSGWWVLVGIDPLWGNLSALPSAPLLLHSPPWLWSFPPTHPLSPPVKGLPSVWKLFLLHSSLPEVQVPSIFFCLCFFFFDINFLSRSTPPAQCSRLKTSPLPFAYVFSRWAIFNKFPSQPPTSTFHTFFLLLDFNKLTLVKELVICCIDCCSNHNQSCFQCFLF